MTSKQKKAVENLTKLNVPLKTACELCGVSFEDYNKEKLKSMMPDELNKIFGDFDNDVL